MGKDGQPQPTQAEIRAGNAMVWCSAWVLGTCSVPVPRLAIG